jgi:hypothetical protein
METWDEILFACAICLLGSGLCFAQGENRGPATRIMPDESPLQIQALAESPGTYSLQVPAGKIVDLTIEQVLGSVSVTWTDQDRRVHETRANMAGTHSIIRFSGLEPGNIFSGSLGAPTRRFLPQF